MIKNKNKGKKNDTGKLNLLETFLSQLIFYAFFFCFFTATYTAEKSSSPLSSKTDLYCSLEADVVGRSMPNDALNSKANLKNVISSNLGQNNLINSIIQLW